MKTYHFFRLSEYRGEIYGLATIWIMVFHGDLQLFPGKSFFSNLFNTIVNNGNMGVEIFLLLSGMSLFFSYKRQNNYLVFEKKRMTRLMMPVLVFCVPYWIYCMVIGKLSVINMILNITLMRFWVTGDQQIWFVSALAIMYLLYPMFYSLIFSNNEKSYVKNGMLLGFLSISLLYIFRLISPTYYNTIEIALTRFPVFIIGIMLGKVVYEKKSCNAIWMILWAVMVLVWVGCIYHRIFHGLDRRLFYLVGGIPLTLLLPYLICPFRKWIGKPLRFFGNLSLECYLAHIILKRLYRSGILFYSYESGNIGKWMLTLAISVGIAYLGNRLIAWLNKQVKKLFSSNNFVI